MKRDNMLMLAIMQGLIGSLSACIPEKEKYQQSEELRQEALKKAEDKRKRKQERNKKI